MSKRSAILLAILTLAVALAAMAQGGHRSPMYDPKTEVTLTGSIDEVQPQGCAQNQCCMGMQGGGMHLILKSETETVAVCVGPNGFVQKKGFSFAKGDTIEVVGSRTKIADKDFVIARQITKDHQTLTLRDAQGVPEWSGRRRPNS